jgi:hypothetical protein
MRRLLAREEAIDCAFMTSNSGVPLPFLLSLDSAEGNTGEALSEANPVPRNTLYERRNLHILGYDAVRPTSGIMWPQL